jgi:hypothetical protein
MAEIQLNTELVLKRLSALNDHFKDVSLELKTFGAKLS